MNPQTMVARTNAYHFGHAEATHGRQAPVKIPSAHSKKRQPGGPQPGRGEQAFVNAKKAAVFHLEAPGAHAVLLAGEFTDWDKSPVEMAKDQHGVWRTTVSLAPGRYEYRFLVDNEWQNDPAVPECSPNSFGSSNSVVIVS